MLKIICQGCGQPMIELPDLPDTRGVTCYGCQDCNRVIEKKLIRALGKEAKDEELHPLNFDEYVHKVASNTPEFWQAVEENLASLDLIDLESESNLFEEKGLGKEIYYYQKLLPRSKEPGKLIDFFQPLKKE